MGFKPKKYRLIYTVNTVEGKQTGEELFRYFATVILAIKNLNQIHDIDKIIIERIY